MEVEVQQVDQKPDVDLVFTKADLQDVIPHDNDPVVISLVTAGRNVHRVLVDKGSSADMIFLTTFNQYRLSTDQLRPYTRCLYGFAGNQVDGDQEEQENEVEVQDSQRHISSSSFIPQRITRSKAKDLGSRLQMFSLFIIT